MLNLNEIIEIAQQQAKEQAQLKAQAQRPTESQLKAIDYISTVLISGIIQENEITSAKTNIRLASQFIGQYMPLTKQVEYHKATDKQLTLVAKLLFNLHYDKEQVEQQLNLSSNYNSVQVSEWIKSLNTQLREQTARERIDTAEYNGYNFLSFEKQIEKDTRQKFIQSDTARVVFENRLNDKQVLLQKLAVKIDGDNLADIIEELTELEIIDLVEDYIKAAFSKGIDITDILEI